MCDHLIEAEPMTARLTYVYQPKPALEGNPTKEADYEFMVYGGDKPEYWIGYEVRGRIPLDVLAALRDAEGDLANWRRSPLRPLLDEASAQIDRTTLENILRQITRATDSVTKTPGIDALAKQVTTKLAEMVG